MKKFQILLVLSFIAIFIISEKYASAQQYTVVNLDPAMHYINGRNFYVADVLDNRINKQSIGVVPNGNGRKMTFLKLPGDFSDFLQHFFNEAIPGDSLFAPVIVKINRMWVSEIITEDIHKSVCDIEMEFLTPNQQSIYTANVSEEYVALSPALIRSENIETALINCLKKFNNSAWFPDYLSAIEKDAPTYIEPDSVADYDVPKKIKYNRMMGKESNTFRLGIKGGYSYRLAKIADGFDKEFEDYMKKLLNGWHIGADMTFFWNENNGAGILFSNFMTSNSLSDVGLFDDDGNLFAVGDIKDDMNILYVGPSYFYQQSIGSSTILHTGLSFGYLSYKDDALVVIETLDIKGKTLGLGITAGLDLFISDDIALGIEISAIMGSLSKLTINGTSYDLNENENLTHINFSLLLHLYK
jgi:hypothetical protein